MRFLASIRIVRVALALAVALWMAGAGCLLGCEGMMTAAAPSEPATSESSLTVIASGDACASMRSHDCCAAKKRAKASAETKHAPEKVSATAVRELVSETSTLMKDCPLAFNATAALSKSNHDLSNNALLLTRASGFVPQLNEQATPLSPPLRLPNRGHTYLTCCSFLI
jgi:hypothetical protein